MKRVKDIIGKGNRKRVMQALAVRKSYYVSRFQALRHRQSAIKKYLASTGCKKLHLGCGGNVLPGWLNADILNLCSPQIFVDVRDALPFESNSFDFVYSEHLIEHLRYDENIYHLRECRRILKNGGVLRVSTPDLSFLIDFYSHNSKENEEYLKWATNFYWNLSMYSKALVVNYYLTSWGHKCVYDFDLLKGVCEEAGFGHVNRQEVGMSDFRDLRGIEKHGRVISERWNAKESLIVEAVKTNST